MNRQAGFTFDSVQSRAEEYLKKDGIHLPTIIIQGSLGVMILEIDFADDPNLRHQQLHKAAQQCQEQKSYGSIRRVYFISQENLSSAKNPDSTIETLSICEYQASTAGQRLRVFQIQRSQGGTFEKLRQPQEKNRRSIDNYHPFDAFLSGLGLQDIPNNNLQ